MIAYDVSEIIAKQRQTSTRYLEFLRASSMSAGIYELPESGEDTQEPHGEDEIYYVLGGTATIRVGGEDRDVSPGSIVFVPARVEHAFHSIRSRLSLLVVFAPAEGSTPTSPSKGGLPRRSPGQRSSSQRRRGRA